MLRSFIRLALFVGASASPVFAITGGVTGPSDLAAQTVLIVSTRGSSCTGTVIARNLVITAGHCVQPKASYAISIDGAFPRVVQVARIVLHPKYDPHQFETRKPSPDMAILKIAEPLPARFHPARLATDRTLPKPGDAFTLAGYGFSVDGDPDTMGKVRTVSLPAVGITGGIMVRLSAGNGSSAGACTGDSGGPAFVDNGGGVYAVIGVVSWSTGPANTAGCGGLTGVTPLVLHRGWIEETARKLGSQLSP